MKRSRPDDASRRQPHVSPVTTSNGRAGCRPPTQPAAGKCCPGGSIKVEKKLAELPFLKRRPVSSFLLRPHPGWPPHSAPHPWAWFWCFSRRSNWEANTKRIPPCHRQSKCLLHNFTNILATGEINRNNATLLILSHLSPAPLSPSYITHAGPSSCVVRGPSSGFGPASVRKAKTWRPAFPS